MEDRQSRDGNHCFQGAIQGLRDQATQVANLAGLRTKLRGEIKEQRVCHHCQSETLLIIRPADLKLTELLSRSVVIA